MTHGFSSAIPIPILHGSMAGFNWDALWVTRIIVLADAVKRFTKVHRPSERKYTVLAQEGHCNSVFLDKSYHWIKKKQQHTSSLLYMCRQANWQPVMKPALKDASTRLQRIPPLHQKLYSNDNMTGLRLADPTKQLQETNDYEFNTASIFNIKFIGT